jgi:ketosteroid isomerase-like protein
MSKSTAELSADLDGGVDDEFFARYQRAWSDADIDAIVEMMTPDGLYEASFGPAPWGDRFVGREAIHAAVSAMYPGPGPHAAHVYGERYRDGNHGFSPWTSTKSGPDGEPVTTYGFDFYEFRDGLVAKKIAYRKGQR